MLLALYLHLPIECAYSTIIGMNEMIQPTKRRTSRPVPTKLHALLHKACPPGKDGDGSIRATLAPALGVSYQYVYRWIEADKLPAKYVKPLIEIAGGRVSQEELIVFVI